MGTMKVASIVGARPNFIKLSPVSRELRKKMDEIIIHTGQHYDYEMDRIFFNDLGIPSPDYHLNVGSGSHGYQTGEMLMRVEEILEIEKPDLVLVFGDTNTTLAGALAGAKLDLKVAHVEAGLRSFDRSMPEEINRILVDHCSHFLFCPTETAVSNLRTEGITKNVYNTGDVMVDVQKECMTIADNRSLIMDELDLIPKSYYLATIHRAANTDDPNRLRSIASALSSIGNIVFPCHPRTKMRLKALDLWNMLDKNIKVIKPIGYLDMLILEKNALKILTDSGGMQKEAYLLGVPCITLRDETEWLETVNDGWNALVGTDKNKIMQMTRTFVPLGKTRKAFGTGDASKKIAKLIEMIN
jgi:UDP-N-acetylglucosamine 2-epimerase